ncbi:MAG: homocysteine biosynthesis protein [Candidatus Thermoplasmatota archaeon]|nr:homocysteine biosynthesis protein [Candidatus Thermoplasmatota archaeon]
MPKTLEEINRKIKEGNAVVVDAEEMSLIVEEKGLAKAAKEVDVVTTGTFGAMCSSGVFLNFGYPEEPIKMQRVWLNDVEAYTGIAAVDAYLGATQLSETKGFDYGGAHVIEDLLLGKEIELRAVSYGTDCYPKKSLKTKITLESLNQAVMVNPRNAYQRYNVATNSSDKTLYTYMGALLPNFGNATFSGAGALSPLCNDPDYETIGIGTKIFLGGGKGYVIGEGTQHNPKAGFGTLMVKGNLKEMSAEYLKPAIFHKYGVTLYVGIGVPIPVLSESIARKTAIKDADIVTNVLDYSVAKRDRPILRKVTYEELKSGLIEIQGKEVPTSSLSSYFIAKKIARELKNWLEKGNFLISAPLEKLPYDVVFKPMKEEIMRVKDVMLAPVITIKGGSSIREAANLIIEKNIDHLPVVSKENKILGILTSWDISKAVLGKYRFVDEIMTEKVITAELEESVESAAKKLQEHNISALPVVDKEQKVVGMITTSALSKLLIK